MKSRPCPFGDAVLTDAGQWNYYIRDGEAVTAREALLDENKGIPSFRKEFAKEILEQNSAGDPHIRRIYFNGITTLEPDEDYIISMLPPDETIATHMEAPFIANIFNNYAGFSDDWCAMFANYVHENVSCSKHGRQRADGQKHRPGNGKDAVPRNHHRHGIGLV